MNERIKQFIAKATTVEYGVDNGFDRVTFDKEKFAELIVKECADVLVAEMNRLDGLDRVVASQTMDTAQVLIKQHFGVEE